MAGLSQTTCSTTQANTEWDHRRADGSFYEQDTMEPMDIYCLKQLLANRLMGKSIKNTRAFDGKPSVEEMNFL